MSDLVKTIRINELPKATTIRPNDVFLIEDESVTRKITGEDLLACIKNYNDENSDHVKAEDFNIHVSDTIHHSHANKAVLNTITQEKINAWDANIGSSGEGSFSSLADLGVTATVNELNYVDGVTSNIQTQLDNLSVNINEKANVSHTHTALLSPSGLYITQIQDDGNFVLLKTSDNSVGFDTQSTLITIANKADINHTQSASSITTGVLGGQISAPEGTDYNTNRVRNMVLVDSDPKSGTVTTYVNGTIICVYE